MSRVFRRRAENREASIGDKYEEHRTRPLSDHPASRAASRSFLLAKVWQNRPRISPPVHCQNAASEVRSTPESEPDFAKIFAKHRFCQGFVRMELPQDQGN
jgi:hypothetical protein